MKFKTLSVAILSLLLSACQTKLVEHLDLIPQPKEVTIQSGSFSLSNLQTIQAPKVWNSSTELFIIKVSAFVIMTILLYILNHVAFLSHFMNLSQELI